MELGGQPWLFALLLWRTALRQAEALKLDWRDLNDKRQLVLPVATTIFAGR